MEIIFNKLVPCPFPFRMVLSHEHQQDAHSDLLKLFPEVGGRIRNITEGHRCIAVTSEKHYLLV